MFVCVVVSIICFILYSVAIAYPCLMSDIRLIDNIPVRSKYGYSYLGNIVELSICFDSARIRDIDTTISKKKRQLVGIGEKDLKRKILESETKDLDVDVRRKKLSLHLKLLRIGETTAVKEVLYQLDDIYYGSHW